MSGANHDDGKVTSPGVNPPGMRDSGDVGGGDGSWQDDTGMVEDGQADSSSEESPFEALPSEESIQAEGSLKRAKLRLAADAMESENAAAEARLNPDLVARAKELKRLQEFDFKETKVVNVGGIPVSQATLADRNYYAFYDAMFGTELPGRPHFDTFRGMPVDHNGELLDDRVPIVDLVSALGTAGMQGVKASEVRRTYRDWIMDARTNDLENRFLSMLPEWDGIARLETALIELMQPDNTELNREFGKYFWLSIYCRVNYPGCFAPMALSLFGGQNAGKSYLAKLICVEVVGKSSSDSVLLDLSADRNTFLRAITGASVIANVGEMIGFNRGDLNKIKDFMTRTSDLMDQKYEKHINQPRQWIVVMDGNKYEGLQRDESGNRRFYPMFVGQLPDKNGQPAWNPSFEIDYTGFKAMFWQLMAECRDWLAANGGLDGYVNFARATMQKVQDFSRSEMKRGRGAVSDDALDLLFIPSIKKVRKFVYEGRRQSGLFIKTVDVKDQIEKKWRKDKIIISHLKTRMVALGGVETMVRNERGYIWEEFKKVEDFLKMVGWSSAEGATDLDDAEIVEIQAGEDEEEGF